MSDHPTPEQVGASKTIASKFYGGTHSVQVLLDHIERLEQIVAKLPVTRDGVMVLDMPGDGEVFYPHDGRVDGGFPSFYDGEWYAEIWLTEACGCCSEETSIHFADCYSTRAAAEAALEGE